MNRVLIIDELGNAFPIYKQKMANAVSFGSMRATQLALLYDRLYVGGTGIRMGVLPCPTPKLSQLMPSDEYLAKRHKLLKALRDK